MNNLNNEESKSEAEAQLEKAKNFNKRGEKSEALKAYQAAAQIFERLEDERGQARAFSGMGKVYGKHKDFGKAVEAFGSAAQHSNRANWSDKEIEARYNQGLTLQQMGLKAGNLAQVKQAIQSFEQGLAVARQINDRASQGVLLISLGFACAWAKDDEPAIAYFREAATFALDNLDFDTAFSALSSLGVLLSDSNRADEAIPYYQRALELAKSEQGDIVAVADTFANLGIAYEKAGRLEEALDSLENYHEILKHAGDVKASDAAAMVKRLKQKLKLQAKK